MRAVVRELLETGRLFGGTGSWLGSVLAEWCILADGPETVAHARGQACDTARWQQTPPRVRDQVTTSIRANLTGVVRLRGSRGHKFDRMFVCRRTFCRCRRRGDT